MAGRRPTPTHLKVLAGNPGKRPLPVDEPKPEIKAPEPPDYLCEIALEEWNRIVPELLKLKLVSEIDRTGVILYCESYARWVTAIQDIKTLGTVVLTGSGTLMKNPAVNVANESLDAIRKMLVEYGMTPASRSKVSTPGKTKEKDGWEDF